MAGYPPLKRKGNLVGHAQNRDDRCHANYGDGRPDAARVCGRE